MLELLLVIVVLMMLAGVVWTNLGQRTSGAKLEFATRQLAGLLRLTRAEAMNTGNCYRCRFEVGGMRAVIEEEADPLAQPGVFGPIEAGWAQIELGRENIKCLSVQFDSWESQLKDEEAKILEADDKVEQGGLGPPIFFYPNGTSDTASILLCDKENRDFTLKINGLTGHIQVDEGNKLDVLQNKSE